MICNWGKEVGAGTTVPRPNLLLLDVPAQPPAAEKESLGEIGDGALGRVVHNTGRGSGRVGSVDDDDKLM